MFDLGPAAAVDGAEPRSSSHRVRATITLEAEGLVPLAAALVDLETGQLKLAEWTLVTASRLLLATSPRALPPLAARPLMVLTGDHRPDGVPWQPTRFSVVLEVTEGSPPAGGPGQPTIEEAKP